MPSKNDLSAFKLESKSTLSKVTAPTEVQEKLTEVVWVRFTPTEYAKIKEEAGMIPLATYLRHFLINR